MMDDKITYLVTVYYSRVMPPIKNLNFGTNNNIHNFSMSFLQVCSKIISIDRYLITVFNRTILFVIFLVLIYINYIIIRYGSCI